MIVEYVDHMGCDMAVCDAARVSMNKSSDLYPYASNVRLLEYLAKHNHWSPFSHCTLKLRFSAPIFIARQLAKHQVGFAWNEVSRRYVSSDPTFWEPECFRPSAENVKQGSAKGKHPGSDQFVDRFKEIHMAAEMLYSEMIAKGVCPEQARAVLPQSMMTEWIWTGSLYAWSRMYNLRIDAHAQAEVQEYAREVGLICAKYFPLSWSALVKSQPEFIA
jgi:thymidylate synthase (FAD)